jgi:hypothetical protein
MLQDHERLSQRIRSLETSVIFFFFAFVAICVVSAKDRFEFIKLQRRLDAIESHLK